MSHSHYYLLPSLVTHRHHHAHALPCLIFSESLGLGCSLWKMVSQSLFKTNKLWGKKDEIINSMVIQKNSLTGTHSNSFIQLQRLKTCQFHRSIVSSKPLMSQEFQIEKRTQCKDFTSLRVWGFDSPSLITLPVSLFQALGLEGVIEVSLFLKSILINSHKVSKQYMVIYIVSSFATRLPP